MATNYIAPTWRMPENTNKDKLSNYSLALDGEAEYVTFPDTDFKGSGGTVSYSFWVKPGTYGGNNYGYFISGSTRGGIAYSEGGLSSGLVPGEMYLYDMTNAGVAVTVSGCVLDENIWNHVVVVFNTGNIVQFYKNNSLVNTLTGITSYVSTWNTIGRWTANNAHYLNGALSLFSIFDYAVEEEQVTYLYNLNNPMAITGKKPVAYWSFGDNSNPRALAGYPNLAVGGSVFNFIPNDHINLGNNSNLSPTSQLSVSAWVKDTGTSVGLFPTIIGNVSTSANKGGWILSKYQNKWRFYLDTTGNSGWVIAESNGTVVINSWQHLCVTWDGSTVIMYLNGQPQTTTASASQIVYLADTQTVIGEYRTGTDYFGGEMSNIALFNTALQATGSNSVETIYNNGAPGDISSLNPVGWWKLNAEDTFNGSDWTIKDYGSGSNDGTSVFMNSANLVQSNLDSTTPYSSYSINLDGVDYLDFNNASGNLMTNKNAISISGWFKLDSNITGTVFSNWHGGLDVQYLLRYNTGTGIGIQWYIYSNSNTTRIDTNYFPNVGDWVHVVGVKDPITNGGQSRVYINSVEYTQNSTNLSVAIANNSRSDLIGTFKASNTVKNPMNGSISNVAYWTDTALTQAQVTEIYNGGLTTDLNSISGTAPSHWTPMDEKSIYYNGSVIVARDVMNNLIATGVNLIQENIVGNAPGSNANGIGNNLNISNLRGDMSNSAKNSYSINMADYGNPNSQGVSPANSGRTTDVPGN